MTPSPADRTKLPTFVIIGAMKSGTTSLAAYLRSHPDVFLTSPKEPNFFGANWRRGLPWYERLFTDGAGAKARGEASTYYTKAPQVSGVPERMAKVVPDVRLIYVVRNPVERIRSMYADMVDHSVERHRDLAGTVADDPRYLDWSRYGYQLDLFLEHFEREQLLVVHSDALRTEREATVAQVLEFIGVVPDTRSMNLDRELNQTREKRRAGPALHAVRSMLDRIGLLHRIPKSMKRRTRRALGRPIDTTVSSELEREIWAALEPDLRRLREIVGPDFDLWGRA